MPKHNIIPELIEWLSDELRVRVSTRVPKTMPDRLVTVTRTGTWTNGAVRHTNVDRPVLHIVCWAKSDYDAMLLCDQLEGVMDGVESGLPRVTFSESSTKRPMTGEHGEPQWSVDYVLVVR